MEVHDDRSIRKTAIKRNVFFFKNYTNIRIQARKDGMLYLMYTALSYFRSDLSYWQALCGQIQPILCIQAIKDQPSHTHQRHQLRYN